MIRKIKRYLRPIPPSGRFINVNISELELFSVVELNSDGRTISIYAPHLEDYSIREQNLSPLRKLSRTEQQLFLEDISVSSVHEVFGYDEDNGNVLKRRWNRNYIIPGTGTRSLGTVRASEIKIYKNRFNKTRVDFTDSSGNYFSDVSYVSNEDIASDEITSELKRNYVRLSLARCFRPDNWDFDACFLQVSCIHTITR